MNRPTNWEKESDLADGMFLGYLCVGVIFALFFGIGSATLLSHDVGERQRYATFPIETRLGTIASAVLPWMNIRTGRVIAGVDAEAFWVARNAAVLDALIPTKPDFDWIQRGDVTARERTHDPRYVAWFRPMPLTSIRPGVVSNHMGLEVSYDDRRRDVFVQPEGRTLWYSLLSRAEAPTELSDRLTNWMRVARFRTGMVPGVPEVVPGPNVN